MTAEQLADAVREMASTLRGVQQWEAYDRLNAMTAGIDTPTQTGAAKILTGKATKKALRRFVAEMVEMHSITTHG